MPIYIIHIFKDHVIIQIMQSHFNWRPLKPLISDSEAETSGPVISASNKDQKRDYFASLPHRAIIYIALASIKTYLGGVGARVAIITGKVAKEDNSN